jgi:hypothetical protein
MLIYNVFVNLIIFVHCITDENYTKKHRKKVLNKQNKINDATKL